LTEILRDYRRVFILWGEAPSGEAEGFIEPWLNQHAYRALDEWFGSLRLALYGTTERPPVEQPTQMSGARLGEQIELTGIDLADETLAPGDIVPLTLFWRTHGPIPNDLKVFVHLLDAQGQLVAQRDSQPAGGLRPTSTWTKDEVIVDRYGVLLPGDLPAGEYRLIAGMYRPASGERLPIHNEANDDQDHVPVGVVRVGR
ncbi:MAG: hypothetical protein PVJ85_03365, partial [Anaerolineae bacterium]